MPFCTSLRGEKAPALQEPIDRWFYIPLSRALVRVLAHTPVTPNMVSATSVAVAAAGAWFYLGRTVRGAALGTAMVLLSALLDTADGQLARATGRGTALGRLVDGLCDNLAFLCLYVSAGVTLATCLHLPLPLALGLCVVTGTQQMIQCAMSDYARLLFSDLCQGSRALDAEDPAAVQQRIDAAVARGDSFISVAMMRHHLRHVRLQRRLLPSSEQLRTAMLAAARPALWRRYATANARLFRCWSIIAPNAYHLAFALASFLPFVFPHAPLATLGTGLFLGYVWILDVPLALLLRAQARSDKRLLRELERA